MKIRICLFILAVGLVFTSCKSDTKAPAAKQKTTQTSKKSATKKKSNKSKVAKKKGAVLSKRSARARLIRVQGEQVKKSSSMSVNAKDGKVRFLGWGFDDVANLPGSKVMLEVNGKKYGMVYGQDSGAVAKRLKNSKLGKVGFRGAVKTADVNSKTWKVKILVYSANGKGYFASEEMVLKVS